MHMRTISREAAKFPTRRRSTRSAWKRATPVSINGVRMSPATILKLNDYGRDNGIGRIDLVENRFSRQMKSRGVYETPAARSCSPTVRSNRSRSTAAPLHLKDELMPRYAELIYYGLLPPEREKCCRPRSTSASAMSRAKSPPSSTRAMSWSSAARSEKSLYSDKLVTFEDDQGATTRRC